MKAILKLQKTETSYGEITRVLNTIEIEVDITADEYDELYNELRETDLNLISIKESK